MARNLLMTQLLATLAAAGFDSPSAPVIQPVRNRRAPRTMVHKQPCKPATAEAWRKGEALNPCRRTA